MPTLNELLDIDLTYQEILDQLEEETDGFTVMDGEVAFSSQFEFETAKTILENHYEEVKEKGLDVVNDEGESAFTLEFSSPFVDDFDFPDEVEESLNEKVVKAPYKIQEGKLEAEVALQELEDLKDLYDSGEVEDYKNHPTWRKWVSKYPMRLSRAYKDNRDIDTLDLAIDIWEKNLMRDADYWNDQYEKSHEIKLSDLMRDEVDESLNEGLSVSKETRQRIKDSVKGSKILKKTNNPEGLIDAIIKLIEEDKNYDYYNGGPYKENEFPDDHTDAHGQNVNKRLKKVHDFWLQFGLDTSQRGIGTRIDNLSSDIRRIVEKTPEYHDSLPDDATEKLPPSEKFKINLFYEWDAMQKNFFGDYDDDDPELDMSFNEWLRYTYKTGHYEGEKRKWLEDAIRETNNKSQHYGDDVDDD